MTCLPRELAQRCALSARNCFFSVDSIKTMAGCKTCILSTVVIIETACILCVFSGHVAWFWPVLLLHSANYMLPAAKSWQKVEYSGTAPSARDKLCASAIGDKIYLFGGFGPQGTEVSDQVHNKAADWQFIQFTHGQTRYTLWHLSNQVHNVASGRPVAKV